MIYSQLSDDEKAELRREYEASVGGGSSSQGGAEKNEKSDFLCRSGSREGVQVDYKLHFDGGELNYDFIGQYWDLDTDGTPTNRRESRINTKLKRIE